jgi:hypothetical protein
MTNDKEEGPVQGQGAEVQAASEESKIDGPMEVDVKTEAAARDPPDGGPGQEQVVETVDKKGKLHKKLDKTKTRIKDVGQKIQNLKMDENFFSDDSDCDSVCDERRFRYDYRFRNQDCEMTCHRDRGSNFLVNLNSRICPKDDVSLYLDYVDKMVAMDNSLEEIRKKTQDHLASFYKDFRRPRPGFIQDSRTEQYKKLYDITTDAYKTIKTRIKNKGGMAAAEYEKLLAALEIIGTIIMMPSLLNLISTNYRGTTGQTLHLDSFASKWTRSRVSKVSWPTEKPGLHIHYVKRSVTRIC